MKSASLFLSLFFLFKLSGLELVAQDSDDSSPVVRLRSQFEKEVKLLDTSPLGDLKEKYKQYLEKQKKAYQEKGELKAFLAVKEELRTF